MELKLDLHIHSAASVDGRMPLAQIVDAARAAGLDGAAICDHDRSFEPPSGFVPPEGFLLIPGVELSTDHGHLLGLFLERPVAADASGGARRQLHEAVAAIRAAGGLAVLAHPFERSSGDETAERAASELDGVEVWNGRANRKRPDANRRAADFARRHRLPVTAGSDAHVAREIGNGCLTLRVSERTLPAVRAALLCDAPEDAAGKNGRHVDVAKSQLSKLRRRKAGAAAYLKWLAFALRCAVTDLFRRGRG